MDECNRLWTDAYSGGTTFRELRDLLGLRLDQKDSFRGRCDEVVSAHSEVVCFACEEVLGGGFAIVAQLLLDLKLDDSCVGRAEYRASKGSQAEDAFLELAELQLTGFFPVSS